MCHSARLDEDPDLRDKVPDSISTEQEAAVLSASYAEAGSVCSTGRSNCSSHQS